MMHRLPDAFSTNRSEETGADNWDNFIVPKFINQLGIKTQTKANVIVGGRGCGKTTLLRYFSHLTQFSPRRDGIATSDLAHIGLYWRADTNFLNAFVGGDQTPSRWKAAFEHVLACELGREIVAALRSINCNDARRAEFGGLESLNLTSLRAFDPAFDADLNDIDKALYEKSIALTVWMNNLDSMGPPRFIPAVAFLRAFIDELKRQLPYLEASTFAVFIDEYENMREEQQKFINGLLKHGTPPLLFNIAMKRNGLQIKQTLGPESIENVSDYREIDLEAHLRDGFDLFAAELLFFRLADLKPELSKDVPIVPDDMRSIDKVASRYENEDYRRRVLDAAEAMLPRINDQAGAREILGDERLRKKLTSKIDIALRGRGSSLPAEAFVLDETPWASVLMPALLSRQREAPERLLADLKDLETGKVNRLSPNEPLVTNNLFGCVNALYIDAQRNSMLFSGFSALTSIARGNTRHFIELIHRIFLAYDREGGSALGLPVIRPNIQAAAVREASDSILSKVKGHGTYGPQLHAMAQCLGSIFRERHRAERQSEPEINHFTVDRGEVGDSLQRYLNEAEKWSVLFLSPETKMKTTGSISNDYVLNPVYSPYFQISFRKKRSLPLDAAQLMVMLEGDQRQRDQLVRELGKRGDSEPDLFPGVG